MTAPDTKSTRRRRFGAEDPEGPPQEVVDRLAGLLPREALEEALEGLEPDQITGPGGLVGQLAGRVIEIALGAELSEHLGYRPGQALPGASPNARNGSTPKTVKTRPGARGDQHAARTARDRSTPSWWPSARPVWRPGRPRARPLRRGHVGARHRRAPAGVYGVEVGRDTISRVTDAVLEDIAAWRRPAAGAA